MKNTASKEVKVIDETLSHGLYRHVGDTFNVTRLIRVFSNAARISAAAPRASTIFFGNCVMLDIPRTVATQADLEWPQ